MKAMKAMSAAALAAMLWLGGGSAALATDRDECDARIDSARIVSVRDYDAFAVSPTEVPIDVEIRNRGDACTVTLNPSGDTAQRILRGPATLRYDVLTQNGDLILVGEASGFGVRVQLPANRSKTVRLLLRIPAGQVVPPGFYVDLIRLKLRGDGRFDESDEYRLPLLIRVDPRAQVNIAGTSAAFGSGPGLQTVDFGILESGATRRAFLQLRSNTRVRVQLSSENRGAMVNAANGPTARIPYRLTIDGDDISLGSSNATISRRPGRSLDGQSYPMLFSVPVVENMFAGRYADVISIDICPDE